MANIHNDRNNNNNNNYYNAVNFAVHLQNTLYQTPLPPHCSLLLRNQNIDERSVIIEFVHPHSDHTGHVVLTKPNGNEYGFKMMCSIDRYNGYFIEMTVNSLPEVLVVIAFSQHLLQYQPEQDRLEFVRIPNHLLDHWCVPANLRQRNLENIGAPNEDPHVGF